MTDTKTNGGVFVLDKKALAIANNVLNNKEIFDFWHNFSFTTSTLEINESNEFIFAMGKAKKPQLDGYAYVINVEQEGIFIAASDQKNLVCGFMKLLTMIKMRKAGEAQIDCCRICQSPKINVRMIHFCVFPNTELWELEKFIKVCAAQSYTHVIIEFWGMLKLDCLKELSWEHGFDKKQIKQIVNMANELGVEIVPMCNCWGHAAGSRITHGKHVVLNQNPSLQYLFSDDGWRWRIESTEVRLLLRQVRTELEEVCGKGEYFHIGCDEAYGFSFTKSEMDEITGYINEIGAQLKQDGRKTIMWADMLLSPREGDVYTCNAPSIEAESYMTERLDKNIIMADWQYDVQKYPLKTSLALKDAGFGVFVCPWDLSEKCIDACVKTAADYKLDGIIHTTWHTLTSGYGYVSRVADSCWSGQKDLGSLDAYNLKTAAIMRAVSGKCDYEKSGWAKYDVGVRW